MTQSKSIAIVEDEANIAMALTHVLRREGFLTAHVEDGADVMERLRADPPALVLLDVMLPHVSGFELCQQMRMERAFDGTRIVLMTAAGGEVERRKGLALGADAFVPKPFALADLIAQVRALTGAPAAEGADHG